MATMRDIRRRIKTVRNIQQITKALKMVAAARLQRAQSRADAARPYADAMHALMSRLSSVGESIEHPLLAVREPIKAGVLVITSDRGMAGSYNSNVLRRVQQILHPYEIENIVLLTVGKKGRSFFARRGMNIHADYPMPTAEVDILEARDISRTIRRLFEERTIDVAHIVYTRFLSPGSQYATDMQMLPVIAPEGAEIGTQEIEEYIFEPPAEELLGHLLPKYVDVQVYRALMESLASEHSARMTAMSSATENAGEMIDRLTLDLNRARQADITRELAEIVGGAEALK